MSDIVPLLNGLLKKNTKNPQKDPNDNETKIVNGKPNFSLSLLQNHNSIISAYNSEGTIPNKYETIRNAGKVFETSTIDSEVRLVSIIRIAPNGTGARTSNNIR